MSAELIKLHRERIDEHLQYMEGERDVRFAKEYLTEYPDFDDIHPVYTDALIDITYRVHSLEPADVMVVMKNPNMVDGSPTAEDRFLLQYLDETDSRTERVQKISQVAVDWLSRWLVEHPGPQIRMKQLVKMLSDMGVIDNVEEPKQYLSPSDLLSKQDSVPDPTEETPPTSAGETADVFRDIYFTNLCKFRAPTGTLPLYAEELVLAKTYLENEINLVNPRLVIGTGTKPGNILRELATEEIRDGLYRIETQNSEPTYLLNLQHPSYPKADYTAARENIQRTFE